MFDTIIFFYYIQYSYFAIFQGYNNFILHVIRSYESLCDLDISNDVSILAKYYDTYRTNCNNSSDIPKIEIGLRINPLYSEVEPPIYNPCIPKSRLGIIPNEFHKTIETLAKKYGKLKGLVLSAGASITEPLKISDYENIKKLMDLNYYAPLMITKAFADRRVNTGSENTIVYVSSFGVHKGNKGQLAYTGSKGAFISSMRTIANELIDKDIRINAVSPSHTNTNMITDSLNNCEILNEVRNKYIANPEDIANIIVFLSSNKSLWINGQDIIANRGAYYYSQEHLF